MKENERKMWKIHTITGIEGPEVCFVARDEEEDEKKGDRAYTSVQAAYKAAVPKEAFVASDSNAWHVKMVLAVMNDQVKFARGEGQLVCKNTESAVNVYIYASHAGSL